MLTGITMKGNNEMRGYLTLTKDKEEDILSEDTDMRKTSSLRTQIGWRLTLNEDTYRMETYPHWGHRKDENLPSMRTQIWGRLNLTEEKER